VAAVADEREELPRWSSGQWLASSWWNVRCSVEPDGTDPNRLVCERRRSMTVQAQIGGRAGVPADLGDL
jgi:hypothetical protein